MKYKFIPVVLTAALTSVLTFFIAAHFYKDTDTFLAVNSATASGHKQMPVNYVSYNDGTAMLKSTPPVDFEPAAESAVKAVVHVKVTTKPQTIIEENPLSQIFGDDMFGSRRVLIPPQMGSGSGVVISPDGYIVTNNHVVAGADQLTVTFNNRQTAQAKVIATDPSTDIAVIKVDEKNLPYMQFGNSDNVHLGQWVLAVGYPLTLDATVTAGIVSAKGRSLGINKNSANPVESFIQTDAAVNPGNSGGALVNTNGQLVGINSAIATLTGSYVGYSYAIPSNIVRKVANDLIKYGSVQRGYLGIEYLNQHDMPQNEIDALGLDNHDGVYVAKVMPNSGAAQAGLEKGDFITEINGTTVHTAPEMLEQVTLYKPGDNISITYARNGKTYNANVLLRNINGGTNIIKQTNVARILGASFKSLTSDEANKYEINGGIQVTDVGSGALARQTHIKKGFVIVSVNDNNVSSVDDLRKELAVNSDNALLTGFYPGYSGMYYYGLKNIGNDLLSEE